MANLNEIEVHGDGLWDAWAAAREYELRRNRYRLALIREAHNRIIVAAALDAAAFKRLGATFRNATNAILLHTFLGQSQKP